MTTKIDKRIDKRNQFLEEQYNTIIDKYSKIKYNKKIAVTDADFENDKMLLEQITLLKNKFKESIKKFNENGDKYDEFFKTVFKD